MLGNLEEIGMESLKEILQSGYDVCAIVSHALTGTTIKPERLAEMNQSMLCKISRNHSIMALVGFGLKSSLSKEKLQVWDRSISAAALRFYNFQHEREQIIEYMNQNNIWHMTMKGVVLCNLYPSPILREMCDNDILYDPLGSDVIRKFMLKRGYTIDLHGKEKHGDGYTKAPFFNFEFHKQFFPANKELWAQYYEHMDQFLICDEEKPLEYYLKDEDFYVYMILHTYKHYVEAGVGIRTLIDCYLYNKQKGTSLDWSYIDKELEKLEIKDFERRMRVVSIKLFSEGNAELELEEEEFFLYFLTSGTYGTLQRKVSNQMSRLSEKHMSGAKVKWQYYRKRLFPDLLWFKGNVPFCYRNRWLIPFYYVYRIISRILRNGKKIREEIKVVHRFKNK